jgi:class 3 adenylate cyclase
MTKNKLVLSWLDDDDADVSAFFEGVDPHLVRQIVPDMVCNYNAGQSILCQGSEATSFVLLLAGEARVESRGTFLVTRRAPALLGEQAYIEEGIHSADVIALGQVKALVLPGWLVQQLLRDAAFARPVMRTLSEKLRESTRDRTRRYTIQEKLFDEFKAHTSETVLNRLMQSGQNYGAPRMIDAIILFSDIRGFTSLSGAMGAEEIADQLGPYLDAIVGVIHAHGGLVDKFIGDAVMALWGYAPEVEGELDAGRVLNCAQEMLRVAARFEIGGQPISIGVGINEGRVFSGNIGSNGKRQWTVLGDAVNMASRFESASKTLDAPIVLGQSFVDRLDTTSCPPLTTRPDIAFKNAPNQTVYTLDPQ